MLNFLKKKPLIALILISLVSGLVWRLELELHGWRGYKWLTYFHWALPFNIGIFLLWVNAQIKLKPLSKFSFNILFILFLLVIFAGVGLICLLRYNPQLIKFIAFIKFGPNTLINVRIAWISIIITSPFLYNRILKLYNLKTNIKKASISLFAFWLSFPITLAILMLLNHKGGTNVLVAIKSGVTFPIMLFSLGTLIKNQAN